MKTDVTYLYLEEIFITSISVPQTVVCFQLGFCIVTFDHFDHYIFHRSCEEMHREVRISTQLSAITFSIQLEFYLWKATLKRSGRAKMKGSCKVESLHDQFIQWIFVKNGHIQLALINFCQNDEEIKKNLTSMSTYQLYVNEMVVRIVVEI